VALISAPSLINRAGIVAMRRFRALFISEGAEMRATQHYDLCWLWNVWGLDATFDYPIEILRYSLPWVRVAIAIDDNIGLANRLFVLGIYLALFNRNWHCETAKLSDWPNSRNTLKACRLAQGTPRISTRWPIHGRSRTASRRGYARVYERLDRVAVVVAETEGKADGRPLNSMRLATASTRLLRIANLLTFRVNRGRSAPSAAELGS